MFQLATKAVSYFIEHFGMRELFGRENYEYYARLTGRILKVEVINSLINPFIYIIIIFQDEWIFFTYPLDYLGGVRTDIDLDRGPSFRSSHHDISPTGSLEIIPESCPLDPAGRLSISLDTDNALLESAVSTGHLLDSCHMSPKHVDTVGVRSSTLDPRRTRVVQTETKSFVCLPQVHCSGHGSQYVSLCCRFIRDRLRGCGLGVTGSCLTGQELTGEGEAWSRIVQSPPAPESCHPDPPPSWPHPALSPVVTTGPALQSTRAQV